MMRDTFALPKVERLLREEEMLTPGCGVLCALSGGADSVCLLGRLYELREKLGFTLAAAHYNHNLRGEESARDARFVRELLAERFPDVPLFEGSGEVAAAAKARGAGLEETARLMRYAFLEETAREQSYDRIATAHTADDNAETVLLHLARGTGLRGLTGIPPVRGRIIRPLLTTTRQEVEEYLKTAGLPHVEDSTNADDTFSRNRVRHQVVPVLEDLYPGFAARLTENAGALREDELYLSAQALVLSGQAEEGEHGLAISAPLLADAPHPIAIRAVRQLLGRLREGDDTCSAPHLEQILDLCRRDAPSGEAHLPEGLLARREYGLLRLTFGREGAELIPIPLTMPGVTRFGDWELTCLSEAYRGQEGSGREFWLSGDHREIILRPRRTGDQLKPPGRPTKTVKKWLVDEKIPRFDRESLPVLDVQGQCAAVAELGGDVRYGPEPGERAWHILLTPAKQPGK